MRNLSPLIVDDYKILKHFFLHQQYSLSTYSLASIIAWSNPILTAYYALENDILIICYESTARPERNHLLLPISTHAEITPHYLSTTAGRYGFTHYWFVPEEYLKTAGVNEIEKYFTIAQQPEYDDYIYLTSDLSNLKGNKFIRQRNLIRQFYRQFYERGRVAVETITSANAPDYLNFLQKWCDLRNCDVEQNEDLACEKMAATNALNSMEALEFNGIAVRVDGEVSAFGIASRLTDEMAVLNFEKAYPDIKGLYQFLDNECARRLFGRYKYINKESDMNIPNLARSKNAYNPVMKLKSYRLTLREDAGVTR